MIEFPTCRLRGVSCSQRPPCYRRIFDSKVQNGLLIVNIFHSKIVMIGKVRNATSKRIAFCKMNVQLSPFGILWPPRKGYSAPGLWGFWRLILWTMGGNMTLVTITGVNGFNLPKSPTSSKFEALQPPKRCIQLHHSTTVSYNKNAIVLSVVSFNIIYKII